MAQWFNIVAPNQSIASLCNFFGVYYDPNDQYAVRGLYQAAIDKARPYNGASPYQKGGNWDKWAEMALRGESLFFSESTLGDCGLPTSGAGGSALAPSLGAGVTVADAGLSIASSAGVLAATTVGFATAGIGLLALPALEIAQHHAQAVVNEKQVLCTLVSQIAPAIENLYAGVKSGTITNAQAAAALQNFKTQFHAAYAGAGVKVISCNDACGLEAIILAHANLVASLPDMNVTAPVAGFPTNASPATYSPGSGLAPVGGGAAGGIAPLVSGTPSAISASIIPSSTGQTATGLASSVPAWLWIAAAVVILFLLFGGSSE